MKLMFATLTRTCMDSLSEHAIVVQMVTGQLEDAIGDFVCLVFVLLAASARPRVVQLPFKYSHKYIQFM